MVRTPTQKQRPAKSTLTSFPAPTGGWVSNRNLAMARQESLPPGAAVLENFFPTATGVSLRRGNTRKASIVAGDTVKSLFSYVTGAVSQLFAGVSTGIRDVTSVGLPYTFAGPDVLTGKASGDWNVVQFATAGGVFLIGVNGVDTAFLYNGTTFSATAITFPASHAGLTTRDLSYVWVYKQRIWFAQKNSMNAFYLPVDSIGGALTVLPLGGVFVRGGSLLWGQAWSLSSGSAGGLSEQCVFTSTEGEVVAYQGLSPDPGQGWEKVGTFRIGRPMGDKAFIRAGGDVVVATTVGFVSLAAASQQDYAALGQNALSYPIEDDWNEAITQFGRFGWRCEVWPDQQMAIVSPPYSVGVVPSVFAINTNTGKWCKFTNWDVRSMGVFGDFLFFGTTAGTVQQAWTSGLDESTPYTGRCLPLFEDLGQPGRMKVAKTARAIMRSSAPVRAQLSGQANYTINFPPNPSLAAPASGSFWGSGIWGESVWGASGSNLITADWVPIGAYGHDISIGVQVSSGAIAPIDAELIRVDLTFAIAEIGT